jgi:hypothetical protein
VDGSLHEFVRAYLHVLLLPPHHAAAEPQDLVEEVPDQASDGAGESILCLNPYSLTLFFAVHVQYVGNRPLGRLALPLRLFGNVGAVDCGYVGEPLAVLPLQHVLQGQL